MTATMPDRGVATAAPDTSLTVERGGVPAVARAALEAACAHLLGRQSPEGWWKGELASNVTMDAEDLLVRHVLGILTPEQAAETGRWIRSQQRPDGSWATWYNGPADLSTTVESYVALRLVGDPADAEHMRRAAAVVRELGGVEKARVFTRMWLALVGLWDWDDTPVLPPELVLLPDRFPLALPAWGCWARQTIVPLAVVTSRRPVHPVGFQIPELCTGTPRPSAGKPWTIGGAFELLDNGLRRYSRRPLRSLRRHAERRCLEWVLARQEADGGWGGIQPPWVWSLLALWHSGYALDHPAVAAGLRGLERFTIREVTPHGVVRRLEACQSPVWDTALAMIALSDAGLPEDHPQLLRAAEWLLGEEVTVKGDWAVRRPDLAPGGWAFEFDNDLYPDVDDTAEVILALRGTAAAADPAIQRAINWLVGMQSRDGGWAAFDADQFGQLPGKLPFCDFGEVTDPPSADVTAHAVEMLAHEGLAGSTPVQRGVQWLLDAQEADGSWFGRWGCNYVYGTGAVVPALIAAGVAADGEPIRRAVGWLLDHQQADGAWGEDIRSYLDPSQIGNGPPTASQTAWALLALLAVRDAGGADQTLLAAIDRGIEWLAERQRPDGGWDEPEYTGTGFPGDFSINYHMYRVVFPVSALGRYLYGTREAAR